MLYSRVLPSFLLRENPSSLELWTILKEWKWSVRKFYCRNEVLGKLTVPNFTKLYLTIYSNIYLFITCLEPESTGIECARNWMPWYRVVTVQWLDIFFAAQSFTCPEKDGTFEDVRQCDKYYECTNGVSAEKLCPDGLVFDPFSRKREPCDHYFNVDCGDRLELRKSLCHESFWKKIVKIWLLLFPEQLSSAHSVSQIKVKSWIFLLNLGAFIHFH